MMRLNPLRLVIVLAITAVVAIRVGLWLKDDQPAPRSTGTGTISGVVVDADGHPLATVNVRVSSPWRTTATDASGRFSFTKLPASTYEISVEKEGYLTPDFGAGWLSSPGAAIVLEDRQAIADLKITMVQGGAIAGVVYDQKGQPAGSRFVRALRAGMVTSDFSAHSPSRRTIWGTDDQGRYHITGLPAGEYVVMAVLDRAAVERVYFPGASRVADAKPINVQLGQEQTGVDLRAPKVRVSRIEGTIAREDGTPAAVPVSLIRSGEPEPDDRRVTVTAGADGRFAFDNVVADDYWIVAHTASENTATLWAIADVSTTGRNTTRVLLTLQPGRTISGRVAFQPIAGTARPDPKQVVIYLYPADARTRAVATADERQRLQANASGEFQFTGVAPGKYVLLDVYTGPWLLDSAAVGHERLDVPFDVTAEHDISGAVLTWTDQLCEVNGTVQLQARALPSQMVVAFSSDDRFWGWLSPRVRVARSDAAGRFVLARLPAGEYFVAAPDTFAPGIWFDFTFLTKLRLQATRVTLGPGERQTLTISLQTPPR